MASPFFGRVVSVRCLRVADSSVVPSVTAPFGRLSVAFGRLMCELATFPTTPGPHNPSSTI